MIDHTHIFDISSQLSSIDDHTWEWNENFPFHRDSSVSLLKRKSWNSKAIRVRRTQSCERVSMARTVDRRSDRARGTKVRTARKRAPAEITRERNGTFRGILGRNSKARFGLAKAKKPCAPTFQSGTLAPLSLLFSSFHFSFRSLLVAPPRLRLASIGKAAIGPRAQSFTENTECRRSRDSWWSRRTLKKEEERRERERERERETEKGRKKENRGGVRVCYGARRFTRLYHSPFRSLLPPGQRGMQQVEASTQVFTAMSTNLCRSKHNNLSIYIYIYTRFVVERSGQRRTTGVIFSTP